MTAQLCGAVFELLQNDDGLAASATKLTFSTDCSPVTATYHGPNIPFGHAILYENQMIYHAVSDTGELSAGLANVTFEEEDEMIVSMQLDWVWLTGPRSSGISRWRRVS